MTCYGNSTFVVCMPGRDFVRKIVYCPTCERRRRMVKRVELWHDPEIICCGCGDSWLFEPNEDYRFRRPFERGWREKSIKIAKDRWASASGETEREIWERLNEPYVTEAA